MKRTEKLIISITLILIMTVALLSGCGKSNTKEENVSDAVQEIYELVCNTTRQDNFGDVFLDIPIGELGLEYGDSINILFSNDILLEAIPYYPNFYGIAGDLILVDYYDGEYCLAGKSCSFAQEAGIYGVTEDNPNGESVTITLDEKGKYKELYEAYQISDGIHQEEGQTDAQFINARPLSFENIKENLIYRGSSPFDPLFNRIEKMTDYVVQNGIKYIIDLADDPETLASYENKTPEMEKMIQDGKVVALGLGIDLGSQETKEKVVLGIRGILENEGPYLIHCSLGRDRTGFACLLIGALLNTSIEDIETDFALSYYNLHPGFPEKGSLKYELQVTERLASFIENLCGDRNATDLYAGARAYLSEGGMSDAEIDNFIQKLHK